ncbi:MAG: radical SAM protein [Clostridia bacterium]|nr:radical SAM protein [Clostridia bacterium]
MTYDILLINTHRENWGSVPEDISIGQNLLTVFLKEKGYSAALFRGFAHEAMEWIERKMAEDGALTVGFYCDYENSTLVTEISRYIKEKWGIPVFVGGPQAVGLNQSFLEKSGCDAIIRGDGEFPLLELLDLYIKGEKSRAELDGISYLDESGEMVCRPDRKPIEDLDSLPWPDFRLEKGHESWSILPVMTGRGCPYHCAFCYEGNNTRRVRFRSVQNVLDEITCHFGRHPNCKYIFFIDDTFTLDPKRVEQFCTGLKRLRQKKDFVWFCEGHVQTLYKWPEMLKQMADAGLVKLFLGIESGSDEVLSLYKKQTTAEMMEFVVRESVKAGIPQITGNIIVGGPLESPETLEAGANLVTRLMELAPGRFESLGFFLMPYPNTAITKRPQDFGLRLLSERETQGLEDIPLTETEAFTWMELFNARHRLNKHLYNTMMKMYTGGKIPHDVIIGNYRLAYRYGVYSRWFINVFIKHPIYNRYYQLMARNAVCRSQDIAKHELYSWHPQRVFEIWNTLSLDSGFPQINDYVFSPLEYELLLLCSGKLRLGEILDRLYAGFGSRFESRDAFDGTVLKLLEGFEEKRWLAYARF